jgi:hypothetical protein
LADPVDLAGAMDVELDGGRSTAGPSRSTPSDSGAHRMPARPRIPR